MEEAPNKEAGLGRFEHTNRWKDGDVGTVQPGWSPGGRANRRFMDGEKKDAELAAVREEEATEDQWRQMIGCGRL